MVSGRVSVLIPARNERFLAPTVADLLTKATGDIEIVVVLDGYWPNPPLDQHPRLTILHRGQSFGMRPAINAAAKVATGEYFLKADAHTLWDEGFDEKLKADYHEQNWIVVPRRYPLDPESWSWEVRTDNKYPIDAHYLSYPFEKPDDPWNGFHGVPWNGRRDQRREVLLDDEMCSQGSAWFMGRRHFEQWLGGMEILGYGNFQCEFQELGFKTWLRGGAVKVNKRTWYAHLHKGKRYPKEYKLTGQTDGIKFTTDHWFFDRDPKAMHSMRWLVEKFWPVPTWPPDLDVVFSRAA